MHGAQVFFLIGSERSGSTLLRLMLDHHPEIACLGEFNFAFHPLSADGSAPDRETYHRRLARSRPYRYSGLSADPALGCDRAIADLFRAMARKAGVVKRIVGATIHHHYRTALRIWPGARFVHLVRDPRDVAPSVVAMGWAATCWHATRFWIEPEREVEELKRAAPPGRVLELRFEDLVARPGEELARLCAGFGVDYDARMLSYPEDTTYPPPDASAAERWRTTLRSRDVREVEARAGAMMGRRGYEASGLPQLRVGSLRRRWLGARNRLGLFRSRMETYGAGPVLTHAFASRLGLEGMQSRALRRIQDIDQENLR